MINKQKGRRSPVGIAGFTITEMLVVLLIAAVAMGTAGFAISQQGKDAGALSFGTQLHDLLTNARQRAIISGYSQSVMLEFRPSSLQVQWNETTLSAPSETSIEVLVGEELIQTGGRIPIHFFHQGGSTGARIEILDRKGRQATVLTNWLTGISTVEDSYGGAR